MSDKEHHFKLKADTGASKTYSQQKILIQTRAAAATRQTSSGKARPPMISTATLTRMGIHC